METGDGSGRVSEACRGGIDGIFGFELQLWHQRSCNLLNDYIEL